MQYGICTGLIYTLLNKCVYIYATPPLRPHGQQKHSIIHGNACKCTILKLNIFSSPQQISDSVLLFWWRPKSWNMQTQISCTVLGWRFDPFQVSKLPSFMNPNTVKTNDDKAFLETLQVWCSFLEIPHGSQRCSLGQGILTWCFGTRSLIEKTMMTSWWDECVYFFLLGYLKARTSYTALNPKHGFSMRALCFVALTTTVSDTSLGCYRV